MPVVPACRGFRDLFDSIPSLMWVARTPADFVYFNKAWLRFRGVELEVETGNAWLSAVHPPDECPIYAALRDGDVHRVDDDVFWRRDGTPVRVEFISTPIIENGALSGAVVVFRDVTNERRLEALAEAVESMNSLGYVFSAVRHELGNPVNSVKMALSVLRTNLSRFTRQQVEDYLDRSLSELGRVEDLLTSLKSYSLYEDVSPGPLALDRFVEDFGRLFGSEYRRQGVDLRVETGLGGETRVHADPRALRQILLNLVANSVEAVGGLEQPLIRISTASSGGRACLRVRDNGCGMSDDILKNLFKPFHTTKAKGTGLGLVIASKMMTRMDGLIDVDSRPGNGTVISLWFRPADR